MAEDAKIVFTVLREACKGVCFSLILAPQIPGTVIGKLLSIVNAYQNSAMHYQREVFIKVLPR